MSQSATGPAAPRDIDPRLVAMLLSQEIWRPSASAGEGDDKGQDDLAYLQDAVFPTLVPALHDLCELVQREKELGDAARPTTACVSRAHPTGASGPVQWLAQYLTRYNLKHSAALKNHPYVVLSAAAKEHTAHTGGDVDASS
jgi:hypothetical protein